MSWIASLQFGASNAAMHFCRRPVSIIASSLVIALVLGIPLFAYLLLMSVLPLTGRLATNSEISVFLSPTATRADADALGSALRSLPAVESLRFVPREEALALVTTQSSNHDLLSALGKNPLPDAWVIRVAAAPDRGALGGDTTMPVVKALTTRIEQLPNVDTVQIDSDWIARVDAMLRLGRFLLAATGFVMGASVVAVVFNTIRLQAWVHREEVDLMRLIGATEPFLRRPFLYQGSVMGLVGGCVALLLVMSSLIPLNDAIADFSHLYAAKLRFLRPSYSEMAVFLGIATSLGWLGARLNFCSFGSKPGA